MATDSGHAAHNLFQTINFRYFCGSPAIVAFALHQQSNNFKSWLPAECGEKNSRMWSMSWCWSTLCSIACKYGAFTYKLYFDRISPTFFKFNFAGVNNVFKRNVYFIMRSKNIAEVLDLTKSGHCRLCCLWNIYNTTLVALTTVAALDVLCLCRIRPAQYYFVKFNGAPEA